MAGAGRRWDGGAWGSWIILAFFVVGARGGNIWQSLDVPPYINCTLPLCDDECQNMETVLGRICPRAASTNFKAYGTIPGPNACNKVVRNWVPGPKSSISETDGCGPCLLKDEYSVCQTRKGGRGYNAGGPVPRRGHSMVRYVTSKRSRYLGATVLILFGGVDRNDNYLNDVWFYCVDNCPQVVINKRTFDSFGVAIDFALCDPRICAWEEKGVVQDFLSWVSLDHKEQKPSSILRRGIVPARPAGRTSHTAVITKVKSQDGVGTVDVMAIYGGLSPNCTDYCSDYWYYDIAEDWWVILYGEWWGVTREWQKMWDYAQFGQQSPVKRQGHTAVMVDEYMFIIGGHTNGSASSCCGYDYNVCGEADKLKRLLPKDGCPYLWDTWVTNTLNYIPFETLLSRGKHATQSSTLGTGVARLAVDGNKNAYYVDTWNNSVTLTNSDSQAWWQIDLGGPQFVANVSIYNRKDKFGERLENFYVLFSIEPFVSDQLADLLKDPLVYKTHFMYIDEVASMFINNVAQYVRIQLAGTNYLSLAEVEVWGYPPVEDWQHLEGMKRWTRLDQTGDFPFGRLGHSTTMISEQTALLYGGFVKEDPYFLNDFWTVLLPKGGLAQFDEPLQWQFEEPLRQEPVRTSPVSRYAHSATFSAVCSAGHEIEELVRQGSLVLSSIEQGVVPPSVYPGLSESTDWCRGQVIFFGGSSSADRDAESPAHPSGYLNDMWIYNVSSKTLSQVLYNKGNPFPIARREHSVSIDRDFLYLFGGQSDQCEENVCGDMWVYNVSGPYSCPNECSGHGVCEWGFCICTPGFTERDCSGLKCPNSDCTYSYANHYDSCQVCNGRGLCTTNGSCVCDVGWTGEACDVLFCPGNCSGHGSCRLGGRCVCDSGFTGNDCFEAECPDNCTMWTNGYDTGFRGDCIITRVPPCCGVEPNCTQTPTSPSPCTYRSFEFVPEHTVQAICQCADSYVGDNCGQEEADRIISEQKAIQGTQNNQGCFSLHSRLRLLGPDQQWSHAPLSLISPGDVIMGGDGPTKVVFVHTHEDAVPVIRLEWPGGQTELTSKHAVQLAGEWGGRGRIITAGEVRVGNSILVSVGELSSGGLRLEPARITRASVGESVVKYIVTDSDSLIVDGVLSLPYSTRAGRIETLPFLLLDRMWQGAFKHPAVAAALSIVLESPALRFFEGVVNAAMAPWVVPLPAGGAIGDKGWSARSFPPTRGAGSYSCCK